MTARPHDLLNMEIYLRTREEWRKWLEKNHDNCTEIWLRYYKKPSGMLRIPYSDAVEEALCFGWIDGKIKRINEDYYIQRFTPRRPGSRWPKYNIERMISPRFGETFEVKRVKNRSHILFHCGNTVSDTKGCILVGMEFAPTVGASRIVRSRDAFEWFLRHLNDVDDAQLIISTAYLIITKNKKFIIPLIWLAQN